MLEAEAPTNKMIVVVIGEHMGKYEESFWLKLALKITILLRIIDIGVRW